MKKIYFLLLISILTLPFFAFGDVYEYTPLVTIPGSGVEANQPVNLGAYLNGIYRILIAITIILAVIVITISGIQHMASESPFSKSEASKRIGGAIGGIVLAVMSWLILFTINPCLVSFNFLTPTAACGGPNKPNTNNPSTGSGSTPFIDPVANFGVFSVVLSVPTGTAINQGIQVGDNNNTGPYSFSVVSGSLPPGVTLNTQTGRITGVPNSPGTYKPTVEVTNSINATVRKEMQLIITGSSIPPVNTTQNNQTPNDDGLLSLDDLDKIAAGERHCFLSNRVDTGETLETCGINRLDCQNIREETLTFLTRTNVGTCIHQP